MIKKQGTEVLFLALLITAKDEK